MENCSCEWEAASANDSKNSGRSIQWKHGLVGFVVSQCNESLKQSHFSKTQVDQWDYQTNRKCQNTQIQLIKNNQNSYTINTHTHSYYAHFQYSRKFNYRRILHITTRWQARYELANRNGLLSFKWTRGKHNRVEICCLCVKMGRLLTMGNTVYSLSQGQGLSLWEKARSSRSSSSSDDADTSPPRRHVT